MSLIIKEKNGIKYFDSYAKNLNESYFDYFEEEWFDKKYFTYDISTYFHPIPLLEMTKEQKEIGQREMNKIYSKPLYQLEKYLKEKWDRPKSKEEYIRKYIEFDIFNKLVNKINNFYKSDKMAKNIELYATEKDSKIPAFDSIDIGTNEYNNIPYLLISPRISNYINGLMINYNLPNIEKKILNFAILHEYGHVYEYLKDTIEKGSAKLINTLKEPDRNKVIDSEGKANAYAIDNMYRKDRRELLKNSKEINKGISKEYVEGTKKYSKTYQKTLNDINKSHFNY